MNGPEEPISDRLFAILIGFIISLGVLGVMVALAVTIWYSFNPGPPPKVVWHKTESGIYWTDDIDGYARCYRDSTGWNGSTQCLAK